MEIDQTNLLESQKQLIQAGFLESNRNWVICAPTGAGKTRMAEWALQQSIAKGCRGVFIAPLKAIVEEKSNDWTERYPHFNIGLFTGETTRGGTSKKPRDENLLLLTSEKLAAYLHSWKRNLYWLSEIDVVVLDEFHLLGDASRGATLESLIGRLQRINPFVRFIGLSATIPNADQLAQWLNAKTFITTWRPVPLIHRIVRFKKAIDKPQLLENEVEETLREKGQVLVFVNSRRRSEQLAETMRQAGFNATFYHAGLDKNERSKRHGEMLNRHIDVLISTSSLEMGVNFPARKVVVYDSYVFNGERFGALPVGRYLQCAGRAGRPGFDTQGEAVLFVPKWHKDAEAYLSGIPDPVTSWFSILRPLQKEIITEVTTRLSISSDHLKTNFAARTFREKTETPLNLDFQIEKLLKAKLLKQSGENSRYLTETPLGRIATQMDVSPETILILDRFFDHVPGPTLFDCLLAICICPELTPKLPFYFEQIDYLADIITVISSNLLDSLPTSTNALHPGKLPTKTLLAAIKSAVVLMEHTTGQSLGSLAERFVCYPMDLSILKRNCDWMLATAQRIFAYRWRQAWILEGDEQSDEKRPLCTHEKRLQQLIPMIKYGLPAETCELVKVKGIGPKRALALLTNDIKTLKELSIAPIESLTAAIGLRPRHCMTFQNSAKKILDQEAKSLPFDFPEEPSPISVNETIIDWPRHIDPYRLRRSLELTIIHRSDECLRVEGGTEPHTIQIFAAPDGNRIYECDCMDAAKGNLCKHVMRARLENGDCRELLTALQSLQQSKQKPLRYALANLWIQGADLYDRYEDRQVNYDGQRFIQRCVAAQRWDR